MKKREQAVFLELVKNSKKSDRDIAKKLNISQPTVTRIRKKLEKNIIRGYTTLPILPEIGINLISFNFVTCNSPKKNIEVCLRQMTKKDPKIIFSSTGEGMGKNCLIVAFHINYRDYVEFLTSIRIHCRNIKATFDSFLVPTSKHHIIDFTKPIAKLLEGKKLVKKSK